MLGLCSHKKRLRSQRGISLVEILVAAMVFAIVVVAMVDFFHWGRGHIMEVGVRRNGLALAEQKLEELRTVNFIDAPLSVGNHGPESVQLSENLMGNRTWSVAWKDDPANGLSAFDQDCKEVLVKVAWSWELSHADTVFLKGRFYP